VSQDPSSRAKPGGRRSGSNARREQPQLLAVTLLAVTSPRGESTTALGTAPTPNEGSGGAEGGLARQHVTEVPL